MIGKGKSIAHTAKAIDYALNKEHAQVLEKYRVSGINGKELEKDFSVCASTNEKLQNRSMSFVLSPEPSNGKALNDASPTTTPS